MIGVGDYVFKDISSVAFVLRFVFSAENCVAQLQHLKKCDVVHIFFREFI